MFDHKKHARLASPQMDGQFQAGQAVVSAFSIITMVFMRHLVPADAPLEEGASMVQRASIGFYT